MDSAGFFCAGTLAQHDSRCKSLLTCFVYISFLIFMERTKKNLLRCSLACNVCVRLDEWLRFS